VSNVSALVLIYDIRGFTAASKRLGTADLGAFAEGAHKAVLDLFARRPPTFVKNLGDGHLLLWETQGPPDADLVAHVVAGATRARTAFAAFAAGQEAAGIALPRQVGIGVAFGEVSRADDYYGVALNLASRLQNLARPEGLAMDRTVFEAATARDEALKTGFRRSRVRLKGLGSTVVWVNRPFSWARFFSRVGRVAAALALPVAYVALADAGLGLPGGDALRTWVDRNGLSVFRPTREEGETRAGASARRRDLVTGILGGLEGSRLRTDFAKPTDPAGRPDVWSTSQACCALFKTPEADRESLRRVLPAMEAAFEKDHLVVKDGVTWGWRAHPNSGYTVAEPALWTVAAIAAALARPGFLADDEKATWRTRLRTAQAATAIFRPVDTGGWNMFPRQKEPGLHSPYTTALALLALLETRAAGEPWDGNLEKRDSLLRSSAAWLVERFDADADPPGWRRTMEPSDPVSPGLTLQVYAELLRAEAEAGITMPPAILDALTEHVASLSSSRLEVPADGGEFSVPSTNYEERTEEWAETINFLWYPWAIDASARWLERSKCATCRPEDVVRVRRTIGHLAIDLGPEAVRKALSGWIFVAAETLYGLCSVAPP
jgi:class 3 adenylate cyclase